MSEMTREQGYAYCIELLSRGDPAYKPRVLARQFLTHYDGRRPSDEAVARLAAEWIAASRAATEQPVAYKNPPWWDGDSATRPVRCTDCALYRGTAGWCEAAGKVAGFSHWRRCGAFRAAEGNRYNTEKASVTNAGGRNQYSEVGGQNAHQPKTAERIAQEFGTSPAAIKRDAQPIATIRAALADADLLRYVFELRDTDEGRALRLKHGIPDRERFELYRLAGITVLENDPRIVGRATKGHRKHGGIADDSDPRMPETRAA